ncbi:MULTISPECIES: tripartite tricarboxylate transporter substrate binding protein [unclassified Variovorax]|jgi:tripartite-type tricarboxylate transporter receptor subunit TctC|uniref:Bug family tripartite tricarboxylate transporter substrate binding protein n=1 Tax=unclassified Variovorax TaxID=663243 RepID=UPI002577CA96|nr:MULTISPECIES: tripartite tricarboxylate transporter substrate binding protein [unclassified Variovorax]MDM0089642.1 tripartite tricarboxylate transporter substrate binding protein [Variovorax sp. J22G40]MDM0148692.1 tripartite tricarboxylate transporter substrate binding protein [Variovorax sp. J2P1-31]
MQIRTLLRTLIPVAATLAAASAALANDPFPSKPVRIVVGFSPGGSNDIVARLLAPKLAEGLGQQVLVENKPGAGGNIAAQTLLSAPPDGHTLMMCTTGTVSIQPHLTKAPFNPETDLLPVTLIANAPYLLLVNASVPATNVKELIAYAKGHPGQLNFASSGNATGGHLAGEMFKSKAGVDIVHVPYKGTGQAMTDLLAGQVSIIFDQAVSSMPYAKSGKLRILGVASLQRLKGLPDVPTVSESGVPHFDPVTWTGLCASKGTPAAAIQRVQQEVAKVLATPEISQKFIAAGLEPVGSTPEQFRAFLAADKTKWGTVIKDAGVKAD